MGEREVLLKVDHVGKQFGATTALKDINFEIKKGDVYSLVGRNGAGKSTIVNIIAGVYKPTTGNVIFRGENINNLDFKQRQDAGIRLVTQHASVVGDLDVAENIFLGLWPRGKGGLISRKAMHDNAVEVLKEYGLNIDPYRLVRWLTPVEQRKLNIIRALFGGGHLVILDEPTTSLSIEDRNNLFDFVKKQAADGVTFILISHYLEEILMISDEITVLRDGYAFKGEIKEGQSQAETEAELAKLIAGGDVELTFRDEDKVIDEEVAIRCEGISTDYLDPMDIDIHKGEIVGFVGFPGSGARELCQAIYGVRKKKGGKIIVHGEEAKIESATDGLKYKICMVPNDRHAEGIVPIMSVEQNIGLSVLNTKLQGAMRLLDKKKEVGIAEDFVERLAIKTESIKATADSLSGGNQQKVVLGKVLAVEPTLLILDEPTVGIDIKSREEIMGLIKQLTKTEQMSVIYLTNDFEELLRIADRVVVFNNGKVVGNVINDNLTSDDVIEIRDGGGEA